MKKFALIIGLFLILNANTMAESNETFHEDNNAQEQKFVNPIFYQHPNM